MNKRISFLFLVILIIIASVPTIIAQENKNSKDQLLDNVRCPIPLISSESTGLPEETSLCSNGCCLPCPIANNFYKENRINLIYNVLSGIRVISFICVLIIVISYVVLPNQRDHPAITVLCFSISLLIFMGVTFFYIGDAKRIQCADLINQSTMKNNTLCGIQGIILIFSTFLLILWCFLLILHLHFQTVWRSNIIQQYHVISQMLVIVIAITFTILPAAMNKISFEFGVVCLVSSEFEKELFWYPLAILVIPGFLIHLWTFIHIGKSQFMMSMDYYDDDSTCDSTWISEENENTKSSKLLTSVTGKEIVRAIKVQWRALILALIFLITYMIYSTFVAAEFGKILPKTLLGEKWFAEWLTCIFENGMNGMSAQNKCSFIAKDHIPSIAYLTTAELSTATLGISIFFIFGTSIDLWSEWKLYFIKKFRGVSKRPESQDASV